MGHGGEGGLNILVEVERQAEDGVLAEELATLPFAEIVLILQGITL